MNDLTFFDKFPIVGPRNFWQDSEYQINDIISGMNRLFKDSFNCIYPYDMYNKIINGKKVSTIIQLAAAGFKKQECKISIKGNILTLVLEKESKPEYKDREYIQKKIASRTAKLSWSLSNNCDKNNIKVSYKDGILSIQMPIIQQVEPEQKIIQIK